MNLRNQFLWKVLLGISAIIFLFSAFNSYQKYQELNNYWLAFAKETEVKDDPEMSKKSNFIANKQNVRKLFVLDKGSIIDRGILLHSKAGIKTDSGQGWSSSDPVYKGLAGSQAMVDYRDSQGKRYRKGDLIEGTNMKVHNFNKNCIELEIDSSQIRTFCTESYNNKNNK